MPMRCVGLHKTNFGLGRRPGMTTFGATAVARLAQDKLAHLAGSDPLAEEVAHFQAQIAADSLHRRVADAVDL